MSDHQKPIPPWAAMEPWPSCLSFSISASRSPLAMEELAQSMVWMVWLKMTLRGVHDVGVGMVDCLRKILRSVLVVFAPHDVYIGVHEEVALMGDLNWVIREDATEVEEAGAFLGDDAGE